MFLTYLKLLDDNQPEEIAEDWGFGSTEALYRRLENDGLPVCGVCGRLYPEPDHRETHEPEKKKRTPGVGGGRRVKLPRTGTARRLFKAALAELEEFMDLADAEEGWLEGDVKEGQIKHKRFITQHVERGVREVAYRQEYTEEGWRDLCEELGADPERDDQVTVHVADEAAPGGVSPTPSHWLVALIGAYALTKRLLPPLVEKLHHDPDSADLMGLQRSAEELREKAELLAARVRGAPGESGRRIEPVSRQEHFLVWKFWELRGRLGELRGQGVPSPEKPQKQGPPSPEKLCEQLKKEFGDAAEDLTPDDVSALIRLMHSRLAPPE